MNEMFRPRHWSKHFWLREIHASSINTIFLHPTKSYKLRSPVLEASRRVEGLLMRDPGPLLEI